MEKRLPWQLHSQQCNLIRRTDSRHLEIQIGEVSIRCPPPSPTSSSLSSPTCLAASSTLPRSSGPAAIMGVGELRAAICNPPFDCVLWVMNCNHNPRKSAGGAGGSEGKPGVPEQKDDEPNHQTFECESGGNPGAGASGLLLFLLFISCASVSALRLESLLGDNKTTDIKNK